MYHACMMHEDEWYFMHDDCIIIWCIMHDESWWCIIILCIFIHDVPLIIIHDETCIIMQHASCIIHCFTHCMLMLYHVSLCIIYDAECIILHDVENASSYIIHHCTWWCIICIMCDACMMLHSCIHHSLSGINFPWYVWWMQLNHSSSFCIYHDSLYIINFNIKIVSIIIINLSSVKCIYWFIKY